MKIKIHSVILLFCLVILFGCSPRVYTPTIELVPPTMPSSTEVLTSLTPNRTESSKFGSTYSSTPKLIKTPSPIRTTTWTPLPKLSSPEAMEAIMRLYEDNGGCELPCWWGITPGLTTLVQANNLLIPLGDSSVLNSSKGTLIIYILPAPEVVYDFDIGYLEPMIVVRKGIVEEISINIRWVEASLDHSLAGILNSFGPPQQVYIEAYSEPEGYEISNLVLFYPDRGILVFISSEVNREGDFLSICPQEIIEPTPSLDLWSPGEEMELTEIFDILKTDRLQPLDRISDLSVDLFYEAYRVSSERSCFTTKAELWP